LSSFEGGERLIVGKEVSWEAIKGTFCKVTDFVPLATLKGGRITNNTGLAPCCVLTVESAQLPRETLMPVLHREDFRNLWELFQQRGVNAEEEVIISYMPVSQRGVLRFVRASKPSFHIFVFPKGQLEKIYDAGFRPNASELLAWLEGNKPIAQWHPKYWQP